MNNRTIYLRTKTGILYCVIKTNLEANTVTLVWNGYQSVESIKSGYVKALQLTRAKEGRLKKCLSDQSKMLGSPKNINNWLEHEWMPKMFNAGIKHIGFVENNELTSSLNMKEVTIKNIFNEPGYSHQLDIQKWLLNKN
ncbi:hypothetical protein AAG747_02360 [Rapidithrix thailandica]|uniref:Uncharacterized protein n=1 Tax=Rapidithrix thailandica TaxID=413964 RepID=A0AAW9S2W6_9BACT